jgi:hypothetical protein
MGDTHETRDQAEEPRTRRGTIGNGQVGRDDERRGRATDPDGQPNQTGQQEHPAHAQAGARRLRPRGRLKALLQGHHAFTVNHDVSLVAQPPAKGDEGEHDGEARFRLVSTGSVGEQESDADVWTGEYFEDGHSVRANPQVYDDEVRARLRERTFDWTRAETSFQQPAG